MGSQAKLAGAGVETARLDCLVLLEDTLNTDRAHLLAHPDLKLTTEQLHELNVAISKRETYQPLAYIRGHAAFYGRDFIVNSSVLVPRPESESMIDLLKSYANSHDINTVIDIGTGSGCLAITAKLELPDIHVTGTDVSATALKVAKSNARVHRVQVQWKSSDIREGLPHMPRTRPYVLLANLPYVPEDYAVNEAARHEPELALYAGTDGLDLYRDLFSAVDAVHTKPLAIITESLEMQHSALSELAVKHGYTLAEAEGLAQLFVVKP